MNRPSHDADRAAAGPPISGARSLLEVSDLSVAFPLRGGRLHRRVGSIRAVDGVSFTIESGETLGLVGESGSGKTTVARAVVRIQDPSSGSIRFNGQELVGLSAVRMRPHRRQIQMVFQDPYESLDPRQSVGQVLAEPLRANKLARGRRRAERIAELLTLVGLHPSYVTRYPHELSGGQRQRVAIARALAVEPNLIVCDEPISALDVSIQAQVMNLLKGLQNELGVAYLFIAHDLAAVRHLAHRVAVMYLGRIVETANADELYTRPLHPYTTALLSAVPIPNVRQDRARRRIILQGDIPSPADPPAGCSFHTRCPRRRALDNPAVCETTTPELTARGAGGDGHLVACHFADPPDALELSAHGVGSVCARELGAPVTLGEQQA